MAFRPSTPFFSPASSVQRMLDFEAALAQAEAEAGVIPATAAERIRQHCDVEQFDLAVLATEAARAGNLAIPIIQRLTTLVAAVDPDAFSLCPLGCDESGRD